MMDQNKRRGLMATLMLCAAVIAMVSFVLPLVTISFFGKHSTSGLELVIESLDDPEFPDMFLTVSFLCSIVGVIFTMMVKRNEKLLPAVAVTSIGSLLFMLLFMTDDSQYLKGIDYADVGFYMFVVAHLAIMGLAIYLKYLSANQSQEAIRVPESKPEEAPVSKLRPDTETMTACPSCGASVDKKATFCRYCGTRMEKAVAPAPLSEPEEMAVCPLCGGRVDKTAVFCRHCGKRIDEMPVKPPAPKPGPDTAGKSPWHPAPDL